MLIQRINILCALKGIKQSELAKELGISRGRLNHYVTGKRGLDDIVRLGICKYFDVPEKIFTQHQVHLIIKGNRLEVL